MVLVVFGVAWVAEVSQRTVFASVSGKLLAPRPKGSPAGACRSSLSAAKGDVQPQFCSIYATSQDFLSLALLMRRRSCRRAEVASFSCQPVLHLLGWVSSRDPPKAIFPSASRSELIMSSRLG
jgi:hypothetical protein